MIYRKLGNTGIDISLLGLGAMRLAKKNKDGSVYFDVDDNVEMIRYALDQGINYIDTGPQYCDKMSEEIVGMALQNGYREKTYISSKCPKTSSGKFVRKMIEESLRRLKTDYIDFYYAWGIDLNGYHKLEGEPMQELIRAKEEGLIKHISFSFHGDPNDMKVIADTGYFDIVLAQYNILDKSNEEAIAYVKNLGLGVNIMGPLAGGKLTAQSNITSELQLSKNTTIRDLGLRFVFANPNVSCALSGMQNKEQIDQNIAIVNSMKPLTQEQICEIDKIVNNMKELSKLYCTGCNYCQPCPSGVNIPLVFECMNLHKVFGFTDWAKVHYARIGNDPYMGGKTASKCVQCGACEAKCPQRIKIMQQLKDCAEFFGY